MRSINLFLALLLIAGGATAAGVSSGGSSGGTGTAGAGVSSGPSAGPSGGGNVTLTGAQPTTQTTVTGGAGATSGATDNSGIFTTPAAVDATNGAGDAAPRTEPAPRADDFNTTPRVAPQPQDVSGTVTGGAGATTGVDSGVGGTGGTTLNGTSGRTQ